MNGYAQAKGNERMNAAQVAVAEGLERMASAIDVQDRNIAAMAFASDEQMRTANVVAERAESKADDALTLSRAVAGDFSRFAAMTLWQRVAGEP